MDAKVKQRLAIAAFPAAGIAVMRYGLHKSWGKSVLIGGVVGVVALAAFVGYSLKNGKGM